MTSITGVCSCAASAASWSSLQSHRFPSRADECGDDWEDEGRVRRQAVALRASAFQILGLLLFRTGVVVGEVPDREAESPGRRLGGLGRPSISFRRGRGVDGLAPPHEGVI